jgi:hypothetical protein
MPLRDAQTLVCAYIGDRTRLLRSVSSIQDIIGQRLHFGRPDAWLAEGASETGADHAVFQEEE